MTYCTHDGVFEWKHFPCYWPFVRGIHRALVKRNFDVFFDLCLKKRLSKQPRCRWFETSLHSLRHHCNDCLYTSLSPMFKEINIACTCCGPNLFWDRAWSHCEAQVTYWLGSPSQTWLGLAQSSIIIRGYPAKRALSAMRKRKHGG